MEKGLFIDALTFRFSHASKPFFENLSLRFSPGKLHFIQGKNGSGKSTLLRIIQGDVMADERLTGTFTLNEQSEVITANKPSQRLTDKIKTVVQDTDTMLADQFTVEQNLQCAQLPTYPGLGKLPRAQGLSLMEEFGIDTAKKVKQLSGGQRQILATVMALEKPTEVLLLDEPTAALDPRNASMIMEFLNTLTRTQNLTVVIISHDKELVNTYSSGSYFELHQEERGTRALRVVESRS